MTGSTVHVLNGTLAANVAGKWGGGMMVTGAPNDQGLAIVTNSIAWGNAAGLGTPEEQQIQVIAGAGDLDIDYSDVQGWTGAFGGVGNIGSNPLFVDADGPDNDPGTVDDNLRLLAGSPCIDAADNSAVPQDITTDLDGNPRFVDDPSTPDSGNGVPPIVDMGAYEFQGALPDCPWDLDTTFTVGVPDLLALLAVWGSNPGQPADFDNDGNVAVTDLVALLANWGPCP